jgi:hypothetical protein
VVAVVVEDITELEAVVVEVVTEVGAGGLGEITEVEERLVRHLQRR